MSEIIYIISGLAILFLEVFYLMFFAIITIIKKTYNDNINVIKTIIAFTSVMSALCIIKMITALILGRSIVGELFCAILWVICTAMGCRDAKSITDEYNNQ